MDFETFKIEFISMLDSGSTEPQKTKKYIFETEDSKTVKKYGLKNRIFSATNDKDLFKQLYEYLLTNYNFDLLLEIYNDREKLREEEKGDPEARERYTIQSYINFFTDFELYHLGSRLWYEEVV